MKYVEVRTSKNGIRYITFILENKKTVITRGAFWGIESKSGRKMTSLKLGRYRKNSIGDEVLEMDKPKSELTLTETELCALVECLTDNYEPFKNGLTKYIPLNEEFDAENIDHIKAIFENPNVDEVIDLILQNNVVPEDIIMGLETRKRLSSVKEFEEMLKGNLTEHQWQKWFSKNKWVLGGGMVQVLDARRIDGKNISDYLVKTHDGFLDVVEIKNPNMGFWMDNLDHSNYVPSVNLTKAITQAQKYIHEIEREANSKKFAERVGVNVVKPRCTLIIGRSNNWNDEQREAYRILNSSYHNLLILSYDHILSRAKSMLGEEDVLSENIQESGLDVDGVEFLKEEVGQEEEVDLKDIPF